MAFVKLNEQHELEGFFERKKGNVLQGLIEKHVPKKDGPFFVVQLTADCRCLAKSDDGKTFKSVIVKKGSFVGLAASTTLQCLLPFVGRKAEVRVVFTGTVPSRNFKGKDVQLYDVEVDEAAF